MLTHASVMEGQKQLLSEGKITFGLGFPVFPAPGEITLHTQLPKALMLFI
jgi:hypothetical protein